MEKDIQKKKKLPYGDELKLLLSQPELSESYLRGFLQSNGIFTGLKSKSSTVPLLCSTLLAPTAYSDLIDHRREKENKTKHRSENLTCSTNETLKEVLPDLNIEETCASEFNEYVFTVSPELSMVNNDQNHFSIEYEIEENNHIDAWTEHNKKHKASVEFKKDKTGSIEILTQSTYTGKPTEEINKKILSQVKSSLRANNKIEDKESRVLFSSFDNKNRIQFIWETTSGLNNADIKFTKISDIDLKADDSKSPPSTLNIDWMKDKINRMHLNGEALQNTVFLSNKQYYDYLLIWRVEAYFTFDLLNSKGRFKATFQFSNFPKSESGEFVIEIDSITPDKEYKSVSKSAIRKVLLEKLSDHKLSIYEKYSS
ncbi:hypothetical protein NBRC116188_27340 [Oceaniserpentilla sp. 4NH20-0058]|uniref:GapS4b family protein n=1 Tax=Oceaniserpentilla sp. 4NH20-0058 TaxID=3127660 RepID=UPI003103D931